MGARADGEPSPARGQGRIDAILDAATELVVELGYERVTVDAIAERARASKATMYRRWESKPALIAEALRRHAQGPGLINVADTGDLRGDLLVQVRGIARGLTRSDGPSLLGLVGAVRDDDALRDLVRAQQEAASAHVGAVIAGRVRARGGRLENRDVARVLGVAVAQLFTTSLLTGRRPSPRQQQALVDDVLLPVLRQRSQGGRRSASSTR